MLGNVIYHSTAVFVCKLVQFNLLNRTNALLIEQTKV